MALLFKVFIPCVFVTLVNGGIIRVPLERISPIIKPSDEILFQVTVNPKHSESYRFEYTTSDGRRGVECGRFIHNPHNHLFIRGAFSFVGLDQRIHHTTYKSDENGYQSRSTTDSPNDFNKKSPLDNFDDGIMFPGDSGVDNYLDEIFNTKEQTEKPNDSQTSTDLPTTTEEVPSTTIGLGFRHDFPAAVVASLLGKK